MPKSSRVVALIPARGGSKSIPKKNLAQLSGKPLIAHSIEAARACPLIDRVIVSTDSEEIAAVAKSLGAEVPFLRPANLAEDDTPDFPVFTHCLEWLVENEGVHPEIWVQLRPTSPLRNPSLIERAIQTLERDPECDSVRAITEPRQNPFKMWKIAASGYLTPLVKLDLPEPYNQPRQKLPQVYWQNGYIDVFRTRTITEKKSLTGDRIRPVLVDNSEIIDIDDSMTLEFAEWMLQKRKNPSGN